MSILERVILRVLLLFVIPVFGLQWTRFSMTLFRNNRRQVRDRLMYVDKYYDLKTWVSLSDVNVVEINNANIELAVPIPR